MKNISKPLESDGFKFEPMQKRFRVWDKVERKFCDNPNSSTPCFSAVDLGMFIAEKAGRGVPHTQFEVVQSTGLYDEDDVEIFEGDIIRYNPNRIKKYEPDSIMLVYWGEDYGGFAVNYKGDPCMLKEIKRYCKVIGNIFESPKLLEED